MMYRRPVNRRPQHFYVQIKLTAEDLASRGILRAHSYFPRRSASLTNAAAVGTTDSGNSEVTPSGVTRNPAGLSLPLIVQYA
jgi:hypothetical protein